MISALKLSVDTWANQGRKPIDQYEPGSISQESSTQILALAATPLVVAGAVAGGGTILFGGAEIMEGSQNIYYGSAGDMESAEFNPLRDTVFLGNQGVYNYTKNAVAFAASCMIPLGFAYSAGTLTLQSGLFIVGTEAASEGAGFLVNMVGEKMNLDPTLTMILGMVASMGTSAGLGKLNQAYNISGSSPKVDVTTTNPASMIDDIDGVPASTGIDVPGAKVDDAVEGIGKHGPYTESEIQSILDDINETGYKNNPLRQEYESKVAALRDNAQEMLASGKSESEVAQAMNQLRRDLGIEYKDITPEPLREYIYEINRGRYQGDPLGPTYEYLKKLGKSDAQIIESACRPNADINKLLADFETWLRGSGDG